MIRRNLTVILYIAILLVIAFLVFYLSCVPDVMTTSHDSVPEGREALLGTPYEARDVPAGNYSGIVRRGGNRYALVSDKMEQGGYFIFNIDIDERGNITSVKNRGFRQMESQNLDEEAIAYDKENHNIYR